MKYCTEVSMQTYLWHPKDTRERAEVSLHAACVHVWVPQHRLSRWDSNELHSPGSQVAWDPVFFSCSQVPSVCSAVYFYMETNCIYSVLSPSLFFSCTAQ